MRALCLLMVAATACSIDDRVIRPRPDGGATPDARTAADCGVACAPLEVCVAGACVCPRTFEPPAGALDAWFDASCLPPGRRASWVDQSGAHHDAVQPVMRAQPEVIAGGLGGRNALYFNGNRQSMSLPDGTVAGENAPHTVIVAASWDDVARTYNGVLAWGGLIGAHLLVNPGGRMFAWWGVEAHANIAVGGVADNTPVVLAWVYDSAGRRDLGTWTLYINGTARASAAAQYASNATSTEITLGLAPDFWSSEPNNPMLGFLGEVLIYSRALSEAEVQSVSASLARKWIP
jgi:Concanavalin A-like lectin/glucanases superfamily